ncbi:MAG TPA: Pvc16 family protein, partial [Candidatus Sulfotelmatobacter sp.]|nr:Pvc16 family protein [Candidatus Sulfotelmatobacter sp.]
NRLIMSYLAIGAVTNAMAELLNRKLNKPPLLGSTATFRVTTLPPDDDRVSADNGLNLFLYKISESPFARNMNWRGDRSNPTPGDRPPLAVTLHYLVTAYSKKTDSARDDITSHQLLGNAMAVLHENPVLNDVHDGDFDADVDAQFAAELRDSFEKVKISPLAISMEEFSKIWTGLSKAYRLSVAYEVSLVEIGPLTTPAQPSPRVQTTSVQMQTMGPPQISSLQPAQGPVLTQVTINGQGFQRPGATTIVTVGGVQVTEADFVSFSPQQIVLSIPQDVENGPQISLVVSVQGQSSAPATYRVTPWTGRITPLRGITGIPVSVDFAVPGGATVSLEIDSQAVAAVVNAQKQTVSGIVPLSIASNGPKSVVLIVNDGGVKRSNALSFEVLPLITDVVVTTVVSPASTTFTITGERLNGADVSAKAGDLLLSKGKNTTPTQLVVKADRVLTTTTPVIALVDGRASNTLPSQLDQIIPAAAFAGDNIALSGRGLSGRSVIVSFGATPVNLGAQPLAGRFSVRVPASLAPGATTVKVTIDGRDTNTLPFTVSS